MPFISSREEGNVYFIRGFATHVICIFRLTQWNTGKCKFFPKNWISSIFPLPASGICFVCKNLCKQFGPDQDRQNVGSGLDPIRIFEKVNFEKKKTVDNKSMNKISSMERVK